MSLSLRVHLLWRRRWSEPTLGRLLVIVAILRLRIGRHVWYTIHGRSSLSILWCHHHRLLTVWICHWRWGSGIRILVVIPVVWHRHKCLLEPLLCDSSRIVVLLDARLHGHHWSHHRSHLVISSLSCGWILLGKCLILSFSLVVVVSEYFEHGSILILAPFLFSLFSFFGCLGMLGFHF